MLKIDELPAGCYVVAVSGGVDSMVLLDVLRQAPELSLVVAHFDHGIRENSALDRRLVQDVCAGYGLQFVYDEGKLGPGASEAAARKARYAFLNKVQKASNARAIITAHHQDDLLETIILNILRGTGRKGLSPLRSRNNVLRPLLSCTKAEIISYAKQHQLRWHEDSTNRDTAYLRNYIRLKLLPRFSVEDKRRLLEISHNVRLLNQQIDALIINLLHAHADGLKLNKKQLIKLGHAEAKEVMAAWLRTNGISDFDAKTLERIVVGAKTLPAGRKIEVQNGMIIEIKKSDLALRQHDR